MNAATTSIAPYAYFHTSTEFTMLSSPQRLPASSRSPHASPLFRQSPSHRRARAACRVFFPASAAAAASSAASASTSAASSGSSSDEDASDDGEWRDGQVVDMRRGHPSGKNHKVFFHAPSVNVTSAGGTMRARDGQTAWLNMDTHKFVWVEGAATRSRSRRPATSKGALGGLALGGEDASSVVQAEVSASSKRGSSASASASASQGSASDMSVETGSEGMRCSKGHALVRAVTTKDMECDECCCIFDKGATLHGCAKCDFDLCEECVTTSSMSLSPTSSVASEASSAASSSASSSSTSSSFALSDGESNVPHLPNAKRQRVDVTEVRASTQDLVSRLRGMRDSKGTAFDADNGGNSGNGVYSSGNGDPANHGDGGDGANDGNDSSSDDGLIITQPDRKVPGVVFASQDSPMREARAERREGDALSNLARSLKSSQASRTPLATADYCTVRPGDTERRVGASSAGGAPRKASTEFAARSGSPTGEGGSKRAPAGANARVRTTPQRPAPSTTTRFACTCAFGGYDHK